MTVLRTVALSVLCAAVTWFPGWWAVLIIALATGALWRRDDAARLVAMSAALAWLALLCIDAYDGGLGALSRVVGGVFGVPALVLFALTLLFVTAGAWSAATIGAALARPAARTRPIEIEAKPIRNE